MVASTMESIEFVEQAQENAIPSANDFLAKWTDPFDSQAAEEREPIICSQEPSMEDILNLKVLGSLSPKNWFKRMGAAITDGSCGPVRAEAEEGEDAEAEEEGKELDQSNSSDDRDAASGVFSI